MFKQQSPLETVAALAGVTTLDVDTNNANRYCIKLNSAKGKEAYYFGTPIYNIALRKLISRKFYMINGCYRFFGSNCELTVTATQLKLVQGEKTLCMDFDKPLLWSLRDGALVSDRLTMIPTYNGITVKGRIDRMLFNVTTKFPCQGIRRSQNCVCFMESRFKPVLVIYALYAQKQNSDCHTMRLKYTETSESSGSLCFASEDPLYNQGIFEVNFYEPKLIQDMIRLTISLIRLRFRVTEFRLLLPVLHLILQKK